MNENVSQKRAEPRFVSTDIVMDYGTTRALAGVDLAIDPGEVHGLLGANGAGKSSLIKIIAGLQTATSGSMALDGRAFAPRSPAEAMRAGVRVGHQELAVVPSLTVRQNLAFGKRFRDAGIVDHDYRDLFTEWGLDINLSTPMNELAPALQASVSLARSLVGNAPVILLDEPTASLGPKEVAGLFHIIRRRAAEGAAVAFVSHRLAEVSQLCERATVLRNGKVVWNGSVTGKSEHELAELIAPLSPVEAKAREAVRVATTARTASNMDVPVLAVKNLRLESIVSDVSLTVMKGEVVGIAGLVGSGRTEVAEALVGLRRVSAGSIELAGEPFRPRNPYDAIRRGVVLVPEERAAQALFPQRSIIFNMTASRLRELGRGPGGIFTNPRAYLAMTQSLMTELRLVYSNLRDSILSLSGGNQQKVVLGRVLTSGVRLVVLDEPTRGVDVGARRDFQGLIQRIAEEGVGVVYISSELAELAFCDRIQVIVEGATTVEAPTGDDFDEDALTRLCFARVHDTTKEMT